MPTYQTECGCGVEHRWYSIHLGVPKTCVTCGEVLTQILSSPVVRSLQGKRALKTDSALSADRDAYARLRRNGLQPKSINGSAIMEGHADTQFEVETGNLFPKPEMKKAVADARKRADDYTHEAGL